MHKELSKKNSECPICCGKPLPFGKQHNDQQSIVFEHVCNEHLPLHCSKCQKVFIFFIFCFYEKKIKPCL